MSDPVLFDMPGDGPVACNDGSSRSGKRRRSRPAPPEGSRGLVSRRERATKRNRILTARYYYWTELQRRRFDDVLHILADDEFFVDERTVSNALIEQDDFYNTLIDDRTTKRQLRRMFPGFDWA